MVKTHMYHHQIDILTMPSITSLIQCGSDPGVSLSFWYGLNHCCFRHGDTVSFTYRQNTCIVNPVRKSSGRGLICCDRIIFNRYEFQTSFSGRMPQRQHLNRLYSNALHLFVYYGSMCIIINYTALQFYVWLHNLELPWIDISYYYSLV